MDDYNINNIHYLENEILELVNKMNDKTCDKEFFSIFNGETSNSSNLALSWFNKKGCNDFCNSLNIILLTVRNNWFEEFNEELPDDLLSPNELIQTYISCKAKSIIKNLK